jgi:tripeptide aminopeptidase
MKKEIFIMRSYERLLKYISFRTPSDGCSETTPSSDCQFALAHALTEELKELGVEDAVTDPFCYVYGHIPATPGYEEKTCIGFIAHMDTVSDFCDHDVHPIITKDFDGKDLPLGDSGRVLSQQMFPHLSSLKGRTLITTDGTTILGADDKAGIAAIMTMIETIFKENIPHGPLSIAFTPDEEIGEGADHFSVEKFGALYAYTVDGGAEGEIEYENFNAGGATVQIEGVSVHPGSSKDVMINAALVAMEFNNMLPSSDTPRHTDGYQGFYHLTSMSGDVSRAELQYIIRDHSACTYEHRLETLRHITAILNAKWGSGTVTLKIKEQYRNMSEIVNQHPHLIENARLACEKAGVKSETLPIRGGTDGARLSFMGLPCPNLGTGGYAYHGPYEHITVEGMDKAAEIVVNLVKIFAEA